MKKVLTFVGILGVLVGIWTEKVLCQDTTTSVLQIALCGRNIEKSTDCTDFHEIF
jgi:hypothetical protein